MKNLFSSMNLAVLALLCAALVLNGCATKKFVRQGFNRTDKKLNELESSIEENQKRLREHDEKIAGLSQETQQAISDAKTALSEAERAQVMARGKLLYSIVLSNGKLRFKFNSAKLSSEAKRILDEFVSLIKSENRNVFIEIHGHTDSIGPADYNLLLGLKRANSVKRYLFKKGVPLHRLSTISYGEEEPIAPNNTPTNRAKNRRVVILVLE